MLTKKQKVIGVAALIALVLVGIISYRIYANMSANKDRASKVSQGRGIAVEVATVQRRDIIPQLQFSANLEPIWSADISSKLDGRVDRLLVDEGSAVQAGMLLATLDTNELAAQVMQAEGNLYANQATLEQAELDLNRTQALSSQGALSVQALDTARTKRDLAIGQVRSAAGNLAQLQARLDNAAITSPRDGIVLKRHIQAGYYSKAGAAIVTVGDISSLLAKATIGETQVPDIKVGSEVNVEVNALPGQVFKGIITRISPAAALPARTFTAEITIPNQNNLLKSGFFAKVSVPGPIHPQMVVVPESALVMREDQKTVYVYLPDGTVQQRLLKVGYSSGGFIEVLDGLQAGEKIVVTGHNKLKDGAKIQPTEVGTP